AIEPVHLIGVTPDRIGNLLLRVLAEMMGLARHRTKPSHLPEQPLVDLASLPFARGIEFPRLAAEILKDCPRLKDRNRFPSGTVRVHDGWHPVVRSYPQEGRLELVANTDIHRPDHIGQPALFQHDRNLPAVW